MFLETPYYGILLNMSYFILAMSLVWVGLYIANWGRINSRTRIGYSPNISVIVPAYNEEKNIGDALKAIFSSNYPRNRMDVIVVDDGCTDNTVRIAKRFPVRGVN